MDYTQLIERLLGRNLTSQDLRDAAQALEALQAERTKYRNEYSTSHAALLLVKTERDALQARVLELTAESENFSKSYGLLAVEHCAALAKLAAQAQPLTDEQIKVIMLSNGFTIKEGLDDLKPYVYAAARAIEKAHKIGGSV